jgi:hypothetical protein
VVTKAKRVFENWFVRYTSFFDRRKTMTEVMSEENAADELEIRQCDKVIVNHQYIKHMAKARLEARKEWDRLQQAKRQEQYQSITHEATN